MSRRPFAAPRTGSALVSTLLAIVVLTIIVTAFLQSMTTERKTAQSYLNLTRAKLIAESGYQAAADNLLTSNIDFTINAYEELSTSYDSATITAPYLVSLRLAADGASVAEKRFLDSAYSPSDPTASPASVTSDLTDINFPTSGATNGPIGIRDAAGNRRIIPVPWVEILSNPNRPRNDDPQNADYNPIVGRFAYWIDDESAKIDIAVSGNADGTDDSSARSNGSDVPEVAVHALVSGSPTDSQAVKAFLNQRDASPLPAYSWTAASFRQYQDDPASGLSVDSHWNDIRQFVSAYSLSDERGSPGIRKINLNDYVDLATDITSPAGRQQIANHVIALGEFIVEALPGFSERVSTDTNLNQDDQLVYATRIAANIYDYIDTDSQPTVIRNGRDGWEEPPDIDGIGEGAPALPPIAFGKEAVPQLTEYVGYFYPDSGGLRIDHTFEFLNVYQKPIRLNDFGTVTILIAERNDVTPQSGSGPDIAPDPDLPGEPGNAPLALQIPAGSEMPAGRYTLATTIPSGSTLRNMWVEGAPHFIDLPRNEPTYAYGSSGLRMDGDQLATSADVNTEILVVNDFGYLDIETRIAQQGAAIFRTTGSNPNRVIATQPFGNDGTSGGNNVNRRFPLDSGDPRSLTDVYPAYSESGGAVSAIAWRRNTSNSQSATRLGGDSNGGTYGFFPSNSNSAADRWVPEPLLPTGTSNFTRPTAVIRDGHMQTIGELGFIYDPAIPDELRFGNTTSGTFRRGGFRTLAIGATASELATGAGQLPQLLNDDSNLPKINSKRAYRLLDIFRVNNSLKGKILVNSALRDPANLPLRSVFESLKTQNNPDPTDTFPSSKDVSLPSNSDLLTDNVIEALINAARSQAIGPFLSLGQISDLDLFNDGELLIPEVDLTSENDRVNMTDAGREEVLRHTLGLLTTKGSVYSIHVVGQTGDSKSGTFRPKSTAQLTKIVEIERSYPSAPYEDIENLVENNVPNSVNLRLLSTNWE